MDDALAQSPKIRRNRPQTEARLRTAVEELLVGGGFAALTPSAVARQAGVDKMLIYRYFGDLAGLVRRIAYAPDFFPTLKDVCGEEGIKGLVSRPVSVRAALMLSRLAKALIDRPVVLELMVWELVERNELTAIMEEAREDFGRRALSELFSDVEDKARLAAIGAVLTAGLTYLALRRRKIRWYNGIDLKSDEGWSQISAAIEAMTAHLDVPPAETQG